MAIYEDERGWRYKVRAGLGGNAYKIFYAKPGKNYHGLGVAIWQHTREAAAEDLEAYAKRKNMTLVLGEKEDDD